jgi:hypothetical protein
MWDGLVSKPGERERREERGKRKKERGKRKEERGEIFRSPFCKKSREEKSGRKVGKSGRREVRKNYADRRSGIINWKLKKRNGETGKYIPAKVLVFRTS